FFRRGPAGWGPCRAHTSMEMCPARTPNRWELGQHGALEQELWGKRDPTPSRQERPRRAILASMVCLTTKFSKWTGDCRYFRNATASGAGATGPFPIAGSQRGSRATARDILVLRIP